MDPLGMLIWGAGLIGLGVLLGVGRRWLAAPVLVALPAGAACVAIGLISGDEISVQWAALPVAAVSVVLATALVDGVRGAGHR